MVPKKTLKTQQLFMRRLVMNVCRVITLVRRCGTFAFTSKSTKDNLNAHIKSNDGFALPTAVGIPTSAF
jgi:hypothetical protein